MASSVYSQSVPEAISYQAVVRDAQTFLPISERSAYVSVEFLDGPGGDVLYHEEFPSVQTGKAGLINLNLGTGQSLVRSFEEIPWDTKRVWMRLSVDVGEGLNILQESPFNTVPYAFYALNAGSEDADADPENELIKELSLEENILNVTEGEQANSVDLSSLIDDADSNPTNELQSLDLSSEHELTISNSQAENVIDLSPYVNTDNQTLSLDENNVLSISGSNSVVDLDLLLDGLENTDADPENELQNLELTGNILTLTGIDNPNEVDLTKYDQSTLTNGRIFIGSSTNEPSEVEISGDLTLNDNGETQVSAIMGTDVSVSPPSLDQVLRFDGTQWIPGSNSDADADPFNEIQDLSLIGSVLSLTGGGSSVNLGSVPGIGPDADADASNEIQDLSLSGNMLSLTDDPTSVDLSGYLDNTDNQDMSLSGNELTLTGDGSSVDLSKYDQSELSEGMIFVGDGSSKAQEVSVSGDASIMPDGVMTVQGLQGIPISDAVPAHKQVLAYNNDNSRWEAHTVNSLSQGTITSYYSIDPLDFREVADRTLTTVDLSENNGIKFYDDEAPFATLRNTGIIEMMAPVHLPHGATVTEVSIHYHNSRVASTVSDFANWIQAYLARKDMINFSQTNQYMYSIALNGGVGDRTSSSTTIANAIIDNERYSYRFFFKLSELVMSDNEDVADILQRIYGVTIQYTTTN
ncbi:MAG: hypothetical protein MK086_03470 [Flavobacteriales bacterium]|nr:hypothetical protein [Flavobacteriales bacterium]